MENDDFLQYEIWKDCKNGCKFCTNFKQKDIDKISSLKYIYKFIPLYHFWALCAICTVYPNILRVSSKK